MTTLDYFTEVCPSCKEISPYVPNPYYIHHCKKCGFKGMQSDLIRVIDDEKVKKEITKLERLLEDNKKLSEMKDYHVSKETINRVVSGSNIPGSARRG